MRPRPRTWGCCWWGEPPPWQGPGRLPDRGRTTPPWRRSRRRCVGGERSGGVGGNRDDLLEDSRDIVAEIGPVFLLNELLGVACCLLLAAASSPLSSTKGISVFSLRQQPCPRPRTLQRHANALCAILNSQGRARQESVSCGGIRRRRFTCTGGAILITHSDGNNTSYLQC